MCVVTRGDWFIEIYCLRVLTLDNKQSTKRQSPGKQVAVNFHQLLPPQNQPELPKRKGTLGFIFQALIFSMRFWCSDLDGFPWEIFIIFSHGISGSGIPRQMAAMEGGKVWESDGSEESSTFFRYWVTSVDVWLNGGFSAQIIHFKRVFPLFFKPYILGNPLFLETSMCIFVFRWWGPETINFIPETFPKKFVKKVRDDYSSLFVAYVYIYISTSWIMEFFDSRWKTCAKRHSSTGNGNKGRWFLEVLQGNGVAS